MFGRVVLQVEPRLAGLKVVSAKPEHAEWIGKLFPWSRVRLFNQTVLVFDDMGRPARSSGPNAPLLSVRLARGTMSSTAARAWQRTLTREIQTQQLDRAFVLGNHWSERVILTLASAAALTALLGAILPFFGHSIIFKLSSSLTPLDLLLVASVWLLYSSVPTLLAFILWPVACSKLRRFNLQGTQLHLTASEGQSTVIQFSEIATLSTALAGWRIVTRDGRSYFVPPLPGLAAVLSDLAAHLDPGLPERERRALRRTLARAAILWIIGAIAAGLLAHFSGGASKSLVSNPILNTILYIAITAAAPIAYLGLGPWLSKWGINASGRFFERRARSHSRRRRIDARSTGHRL